MAEVKTVQSLYFSPTGTTKKIVSKIAENIDLPLAQPIDLTLPKDRESFKGKVQGNLLLVGSPVYHGSPPWPILEPLNKLEGHGKWAIPVAVYGNRTPETCVEELTKILRRRGFKVLAAASFIAEHSCSYPAYQIAKGRPDKADMETIAEFGMQIKNKLASSQLEIQISDRLKNIVTNEFVDSFPEGYYKQVLDLMKNMIHVDFENYASCTNCMSCENACPTSALNIGSKEIDPRLCIWCTACARACPEGVFSFRLNNESPANFERLDKIFGGRKEPKLFL